MTTIFDDSVLARFSNPFPRHHARTEGMPTKMTRLTCTALTFAALTAVAAPSTGCFLLGGYDGAFIEKDDVSLDVYGDSGFRAAGEEGDVYVIVRETAVSVNGWVGETVQGIATVVQFLNNHRETAREGEWRVYGPFNDDDGRDLSWLVKISGDADATAYEAWVGARGASRGNMDKLLEGDIVIDGDERRGGFSLFFDAVEAHQEMKQLEDAGVTFTGSIDVSFTRDVSTEQKTVDVKFNDFRAEAVLGEAWFSNENYGYDRDGDGNGTFHLAVHGTWDDNAWGGQQTNKMVLDARWNADESGRTRGQILDVENADSGLPNGDLIIHECFDVAGSLTWRDINDNYDVEYPWYDMGDATLCSFTEDDLGG